MSLKVESFDNEDNPVFEQLSGDNVYSWKPFDTPKRILSALTSGYFGEAYIEITNCDEEFIGVLKYVSKMYGVSIYMVDSDRDLTMKLEI